MTLSTDRLNRLPFHLERWHEPMSIVIILNENELLKVSNTITKINRSNIRLTLYIIKNLTNNQNKCIYYKQNNKMVFSTYCYPYNELRDLAIETIQTSHYLLLDGDAIITSMN